MVTRLLTRFWSLAALLAVGGVAARAEAGWLTIRNDTNRPVVVQESACWSGQHRRCKPVRLLPGETVREFRPITAAAHKVEVFDGQNPAQTLFSGPLPIKVEDQVFSITTDGKATFLIPVMPPATAVKHER